jgi:large subunit ribosomal protein L15
MGTHGGGARKKRKGSGHRGGKGMSGSGKRADHKKTLITKLYGHGYFGKKGITSIGTKKDKSHKINIQEIESNMDNYVKKGIAKKTAKGYELDLSSYKILGTGEAKNKLIIKAREASESAMKKIKKAGGNILVKENSTEEKEEKVEE